MLVGTFICEECSVKHQTAFPVLATIKTLDEVFDTTQMKLMQFTQGNKSFNEHVIEYSLKDMLIQQKYNTDGMVWYYKSVWHAVRGLSFEVEMPPRTDKEKLIRHKDAGVKKLNQGLMTVEKSM